jgi:3-hydroxyacyl-[acyl-carrier-protein] dehydratase
MSAEFQTALSHLPHGAEFRFLDRIIELTRGQNGVGEYTIRGDEPFLRGHFPGNPIFPGVLLIEAAAQLAGCVAQSDPKTHPLPGLKLTAVKNAKILGAARPGQTLRIAASVTARLANLIQASATVHLDTQLILQCDLVLAGTVL